MLRYRCPSCSQLLQAHELRVGKRGVCTACLTTHTIPTDRSLWLDETGAPLYASPPPPIGLPDHGPHAVSLDVTCPRVDPVMPSADPGDDQPEWLLADVEAEIGAEAGSPIERSSSSRPIATNPSLPEIDLISSSDWTPPPVNGTDAGFAALTDPFGEQGDPPVLDPSRSRAGPDEPAMASDQPAARDDRSHDGRLYKPEGMAASKQPAATLEEPPARDAAKEARADPAGWSSNPSVMHTEPQSSSPGFSNAAGTDPSVLPEPIQPPWEAETAPLPQESLELFAAVSTPAADAHPGSGSASPVPASPDRGESPAETQTRPVLDPVDRPGPTHGTTRGSTSVLKPPTPTPRGVEAGTTRAATRPLHVRTQADLAAALTEALTSRMRPRRKPPRDLRPSTALWLLLSTLTVLICVFGLLNRSRAESYGRWVVGLGAVQVAIGYLWIVWLAARRRWQRGLSCAVPPLTLYFLAQQKYARFRPLRFVLTGGLLAGLGLAVPRIASILSPLVPEDAGNTARLTERRDEPTSKLHQLRALVTRKAYDPLIELLRCLARTDELLSADARDRDELAAEIRSLTEHYDTGVRVAALEAYTRWGGHDARELCLRALGQTEEEKLTALRLLPQWRDTEAAPSIARAVAAQISRPGLITNRAATALEEIGGPAAEQAALGLLTRSDDQATRILVLNLLEKVGGERAVAALRNYAATLLDQTIRAKTLETIGVIQSRLGP